MSCVAPERLAAAVSGEDADALAHAATCARCAVLLAEQTDVATAARALPPPPIANRAELAAEFAARLEWRTAAALDVAEPRSRRWGYAVAGVVAVAATIAIVLGMNRAASSPAIAVAPAPVAAPQPASAPEPAPVIPVEPAPAPAPHPVAVVTHAPRPPVAPAPKVVAPEPPVQAPAPAPIDDDAKDRAADSALAFRAGWQALRGGRNEEAIAAFDRATDPAVKEDARYWAAIAAERAGNHAGARGRLRDFLEVYPQSPHADAARAALAKP